VVVAAGDPPEVHQNRRAAYLLCGVTGVVPGLLVGLVLGLVLGPIVGAVAAVVVVAAVTVGVWRGATSYTLSVLGARVPRSTELARLANVVDGLCATFGVPTPEILVVDDPLPNACTVGRDPGSAVLVVTTGLISRLGLIETEGVVAHELAHVKAHDTVRAGVAVLALAPLNLVVATDGLLHSIIGPGREYRADQTAALAVRYPPGLGDALAQMAAGEAPAAGSVFTGRRWSATRWLWIDPMVGVRGQPTGPDTTGQLDATSVRIAALAEW
jgi:Zn-dependent protease with chaperone function